MKIYRLNKTILRFRNGAGEFLKAYASNRPEAQHSAFLDTKGRIVAVCEQILLNPEEALVALEVPFVGRLKAHLAKYLPFSSTVIEDTDLKAYVVLEGDAEFFPGEYRIGRMLISRRAVESNVSEGEWTLFRVRNRWPLQGIDFDGEFILNLDDDAYVSYDKGCYLGQEIVAKVHHRSKPSKRLAVKPAGQCSSEELSRMTSKIWDPLLNDEAGFVFGGPS